MKDVQVDRSEFEAVVRKLLAAPGRRRRCFGWKGNHEAVIGQRISWSVFGRQEHLAIEISKEEA